MVRVKCPWRGKSDLQTRLCIEFSFSCLACLTLFYSDNWFEIHFPVDIKLPFPVLSALANQRSFRFPFSCFDSRFLVTASIHRCSHSLALNIKKYTCEQVVFSRHSAFQVVWIFSRNKYSGLFAPPYGDRPPALSCLNSLSLLSSFRKMFSSIQFWERLRNGNWKCESCKSV